MSEPDGRISATRTVGTFLFTGRACPDTLLHVLGRAFGHQLPDEERAAQPLAGGIVQHGYQCGMIWGAALAAGARAHRLLGDGPRAQVAAIEAARRLVDAFRATAGAIDCFDITQVDHESSKAQMFTYFLLKGGTVGCCRMAATYAPVALREIGAGLSAEASGEDAPPGPVGCAAALARKLGASHLREVMAAGLAGGVGLCGGGCGALGAAIWFIGLRSLARGASKVSYKHPAALDAIEAFLKRTGHELECSAIVGRRFESVADHAEHVRRGGCAEIVDALAACASA